MNIPLKPTRVLSISLESGGVRLLLSSLATHGLRVEKAEWIPLTWVEASNDQYSTLAALLAEKRMEMEAQDARIRVSLPVEAALFRLWSFPFRSRTKVRRAAAFLQETELPFDGSELFLRLCPAGKKGTEYYTLAVGLLRTSTEALVSTLAEYGIVPEILTVQPFPLLNILPRPIRHAGEHVPIGGEGYSMPSGFEGISRKVRGFFSPTMNPKDDNLDDSLCLTVQQDTLSLFVISNGYVRNTMVSGVRWPLNATATEMIIYEKRLLNEARILLEVTGATPVRIFATGQMSPCSRLSGGIAEAFGVPQLLISSELLPFSLSIPPELATMANSPGQNISEWSSALGLAGACHISLFGRMLPVPPSIYRIFAKQPDFLAGLTSPVHSGFSSFFIRGRGQIVLWLLVLCMAWGTTVWTGAQNMQAESTAIEQQIRNSFQKAVPEVKNRFNPSQMLAILNERIAALGGQDEKTLQVCGTLDLLRAIHDATPETVTITLHSISIDRQRLFLSGSAPDFSKVEELREALESIAGLSEVRILSASAQRQQNLVNFEIDCVRGALP